MADYINVNETLRWTGHAAGADLDELTATITAVSRMVEAHCQRQFSQVTEARDLVANNVAVLELGPFNDLVSVTSLATDDSGDGTFATSLATTGYALEPSNSAGPESRPYTSVRRLDDGWPVPTCGTTRQARVRITGVWGWPAVPEAIKAACRIQVARIFKRADSPLGVAGFGEFGAIRVPAQLDPDVRSLLQPYRILAGIA